MSEGGGGRAGLPVSNSRRGLSGRNATSKTDSNSAQELCESRGGRPGLPSVQSLWT